MTALARNGTDATAAAQVMTDPNFNGILHTTCIVTMLDGGHATNALPQRAGANINCRIFPGTSVEQVRDKLVELVADPQITVTTLGARSDVIKAAPPLTSEIMKPIEVMAGEIWP
jgi:acetylornithine deacetylase/succinyl-diaminopimelate desuccinylase-like protein